MHRRQAPKGMSLRSWQRVGIRMPTDWDASRMVLPRSTTTSTPSIFKWIFAISVIFSIPLAEWSDGVVEYWAKYSSLWSSPLFHYCITPSLQGFLYSIALNLHACMHERHRIHFSKLIVAGVFFSQVIASIGHSFLQSPHILHFSGSTRN